MPEQELFLSGLRRGLAEEQKGLFQGDDTDLQHDPGVATQTAECLQKEMQLSKFNGSTLKSCAFHCTQTLHQKKKCEKGEHKLVMCMLGV